MLDVYTRCDLIARPRRENSYGSLMACPTFLGPHITIRLTPEHAAPTGGGATGTQKLGLSVASQQQTNWCWAAVAASVSSYYDAASAWSQCSVANSSLPRSDCCGQGAADPTKCNRAWCLGKALNSTSNLAQMLSRRLSLAEIRTDLARNSPVGSRVEWPGGGGHFQVIIGWLVSDDGTEYIDVSDPWYEDSQVAFSEFAESYQLRGEWTHSYLTKSAIAASGAGAAISSINPAAFGA
jgi:hypothetical protein